MENPRWLSGLKDISIFTPPPRVTVLCRRESAEEEYSIDQFNGKFWWKQGDNPYAEWTTIPPLCMMNKPRNGSSPPLNTLILIDVVSPRYFGAHIGKLLISKSRKAWQLQSPFSGDWIDIQAKYVKGWLPLYENS